MFQSLVSDTEKGGKASNGDAGGADGDHLVVSRYRKFQNHFTIGAAYRAAAQ